MRGGNHMSYGMEYAKPPKATTKRKKGRTGTKKMMAYGKRDPGYVR